MKQLFKRKIFYLRLVCCIESGTWEYRIKNPRGRLKLRWCIVLSTCLLMLDILFVTRISHLEQNIGLQARLTNQFESYFYFSYVWALTFAISEHFLPLQTTKRPKVSRVSPKIISIKITIRIKTSFISSKINMLQY